MISNNIHTAYCKLNDIILTLGTMGGIAPLLASPGSASGFQHRFLLDSDGGVKCNRAAVIDLRFVYV